MLDMSRHTKHIGLAYHWVVCESAEKDLSGW